MNARHEDRIGMMPDFDKTYWEEHWTPTTGSAPRPLPAHPYLQAELATFPPSTALDAGCGAGSEALWLAGRGWLVTAADISATALASGRSRAADADLDVSIEWVEQDLSHWKPGREWDLVVTSYAHASIGQLAFYRRIASWVAPGGTLLIVGHLSEPDRHEHGHPEEATASLEAIAGLFAPPDWNVEAGYEHTRTVDQGEISVQLRDVIVRARRLPNSAPAQTDGEARSGRDQYAC